MQQVHAPSSLKIIQLTPGAGEMYCGNCLRDNALVACLIRLGHDVCMVPLYLPLTLDEPDQSENIPVFFGGVNVFLDHKIPWLWRFVPQRMRRLLDSRKFLKSLGRNAFLLLAAFSKMDLRLLPVSFSLGFFAVFLAMTFTRCASPLISFSWMLRRSF